MADKEYLIKESTLTDIANAIRYIWTWAGDRPLTPAEMPEELFHRLSTRVNSESEAAFNAGRNQGIEDGRIAAEEEAALELQAALEAAEIDAQNREAAALDTGRAEGELSMRISIRENSRYRLYFRTTVAPGEDTASCKVVYFYMDDWGNVGQATDYVTGLSGEDFVDVLKGSLVTVYTTYTSCLLDDSELTLVSGQSATFPDGSEASYLVPAN